MRTSPYLEDVQSHRFDPRLATLIGLEEAIVLQIIHLFIFQSRWMMTGQDGTERSWVFQTHAEWHHSHFSYWSIPTIRRIFDRLKENELIITEQFGKWDSRKKALDPTNRVLWYTINYQALNKLYVQQAKEAQALFAPVPVLDMQPQPKAEEPPPAPGESDREIGIFTDESKKKPEKPRGELTAADPMVKKVFEWWTRKDEGYPSGLVTNQDAAHAKKIAKLAYQQNWTEDELYGYLQGAYTYLMSKPADRSGWSWAGHINIGVFIKQLPQWYSQVWLIEQRKKERKPLSETMGYMPVVPKRNRGN